MCSRYKTNGVSDNPVRSSPSLLTIVECFEMGCVTNAREPASPHGASGAVPTAPIATQASVATDSAASPAAAGVTTDGAAQTPPMPSARHAAPGRDLAAVVGATPATAAAHATPFTPHSSSPHAEYPSLRTDEPVECGVSDTMTGNGRGLVASWLRDLAPFGARPLPEDLDELRAIFERVSRDAPPLDKPTVMGTYEKPCTPSPEGKRARTSPGGAIAIMPEPDAESATPYQPAATFAPAADHSTARQDAAAVAAAADAIPAEHAAPAISASSFSLAERLLPDPAGQRPLAPAVWRQVAAAVQQRQRAWPVDAVAEGSQASYVSPPSATSPSSDGLAADSLLRLSAVGGLLGLSPDEDLLGLPTGEEPLGLLTVDGLLGLQTGEDRMRLSSIVCSAAGSGGECSGGALCSAAFRSTVPCCVGPGGSAGPYGVGCGGAPYCTASRSEGLCGLNSGGAGPCCCKGSCYVACGAGPCNVGYCVNAADVGYGTGSARQGYDLVSSCAIYSTGSAGVGYGTGSAGVGYGVIAVGAGYGTAAGLGGGGARSSPAEALLAAVANRKRAFDKEERRAEAQAW